MQSVLLEDVIQEGGVQLSDRLKVYVLTGIERTLGDDGVLTWHGEALSCAANP